MPDYAIKAMVILWVAFGALFALAGTVIAIYTLCVAAGHGAKHVASKDFWASKTNSWLLKALLIWCAICIAYNIVASFAG